MSENNLDRDWIDRNQLGIAFSSLNVSVRSMGLAMRCVALAQLALMADDKKEALDQLSALNGYLNDTSKYLEIMSGAAKVVADAD